MGLCLSRNQLCYGEEECTGMKKVVQDFSAAKSPEQRVICMHELIKVLTDINDDNLNLEIDAGLCGWVAKRVQSQETEVAFLALDATQHIARRGAQMSKNISFNILHEAFQSSGLLDAVKNWFLKKEFENLGGQILNIQKNNQVQEQKTIIINDLMRVEGDLYGMNCILEHYSNKTTARELRLHQTLTIFLNLDIDEYDKSDQQSQEISLKSAFNKMQTQLFKVLGQLVAGNIVIRLILSSQPNNILEKISEKLEYFSSFIQRASTEQDYKTEQNLCVSILSLLESLLTNDHQHIMKFTENMKNIENVIKLSGNIKNNNVIGEQIEKQSYKQESADIRWRSLRIIEIIADDGWIFQDEKQKEGIKMAKVSCESICNSGGGKGLENERIEYGGLDVLHSMTGEVINRDECYLNPNWKSWLEKLIETEEEQGSFEEIDNILYATLDEPGKRIAWKAYQLKESIQRWWINQSQLEQDQRDFFHWWGLRCYYR
ncbi:MAG: hypothetical protein EZS28_007803 [Streblomastix strix]|uniref:Uncharacterized protein n=1 Tax=Streblomastix strix TaxID=222440 RepID=A0A5J4WPB1_9EUKA|nr:MAG: hypothetical protein EZS28_007803 [Streblomastix strix]